MRFGCRFDLIVESPCLMLRSISIGSNSWLMTNFLSLTAEFHENSVSYRSSTVYTKNDILLLLGKKYYFNFNWTNDQFPVLPAKFDETISISLRSVQHLAAFFLLSCFTKKNDPKHFHESVGFPCE